MTLIERLKVKKTIWILAIKKGCSIAHARSMIQECLDYAWDSAWAPGNIQGQVNWQRLFPGGKKPSVEQFIFVITNKVKAGEYPHIL